MPPDIQALAREAGFIRAAVTGASELPAPRREAFRQWLAAGHAGCMSYLATNVEARFHPAACAAGARRPLVGARSVICLAARYDKLPTGGEARPEACCTVARYAAGRDYHKRLAAMCRRLMDLLRQALGRFEGRCCVDSSPLAERSLAAAAGLGWIGRNGCLIVPGEGSYVLLAEIVSTAHPEELASAPLPAAAGGCGDCRLCVQACPAGACLGDGMIDARRCLSCLTVEHDGDIEDELLASLGGAVFGCDRCQEACPHNAAASEEPMRLDLVEVLLWTRPQWDAATSASAMRRCGYDAFMRNAVAAAGNSGRPELADAVRVACGRCASAAKVGRWAIARLTGIKEPGV
jgi:epoxyqueuosine reductase